MKCPHCDNEIPGSICVECGEKAPEGAKYCMACGVLLTSDDEESSAEDNGFDLEDRVLCSDGTCTGIIIDGKCSECRKPG